MAVALIGMLSLAGCGKSLEEQPGYERAHDRAELLCTFSPPAPPNAGSGYLYSDRYARCVKQTTEEYMNGNKTFVP